MCCASGTAAWAGNLNFSGTRIVLIPDVILEIQFDTPLKVSGALCAVVRLSGANPTKSHSGKPKIVVHHRTNRHRIAEVYEAFAMIRLRLIALGSTNSPVM